MKITKRAVDAVKPLEKEKAYPDDELKGFYLKVTPAGSKIYLVQYRMGGRGYPTRRYYIGKHGTVTPDQARTEAKRLLGEIAKGVDPHSVRQTDKQSITVAQLCEMYLRDGVSTKKPSTIATDKGRITRHILPLIGKRKVKDLTKADIRRCMNDIAKGKTAKNVKTGKFGLARVKGGDGTARRTIGMLGGIMSFAVEAGYIDTNPVHGVKRTPDKKNERYLSPQEITRLGEVLRDLEADGSEYPYALAAIRLLLLTGCRKSEILELTWDEVDFHFGCLRLADSKTGQKIVPLGAPALQILANLDRIEGNEYVLPAQKGNRHYVGLPKSWKRIRELAGLNDVRIHDLRHSFASIGAGSGLGLPVVGKLLGHADPKTTARYAHIADDPLRAAADRISGSISNLLTDADSCAQLVKLEEHKKVR